jgi:hypothetical protein
MEPLFNSPMDTERDTVIERAHDLAAVSHLIPSGEWTPALVALVAALHDLTKAESGN